VSPRVSIVIVAMRDGPMLRDCLSRLEALPDQVSFEVIVVLCGCSDAETQPLRAETSVKVLHSSVNLGLAGALNLARDALAGEFIVSLHDDAQPEPGWLAALVETADEEPGAGAIGGLVLNPDGSVQSAGARLLADGGVAEVWDGAPPPASAFTKRRSVDYLPSCSLLVRTSTFDRVGGADERFYPIYYVDVDFCLAIRMRGERVICEPRSVLTHRRGASTARDFAVFVTARNRELLREKWGDALSGSPPKTGMPEQALTRDAAVRELRQLTRLAEVNAAYAAQLRGERDEARARLTELGDRAMTLQAQADLLERVRAGGWWRLRGRLLPLLRVATAIRRAIRRG
jgi:GT2 family glycosyltransferase